MRKLTLLRHAKSSWSDADVSDHDRPLNARGTRDAPEMANRLVQRGCIPDTILCSSALRTQQTAQAMAVAFKLTDDQLIIDESLYLASAAELLEMIALQAPVAEHIMVIAHNPGLEVLARTLNQQVPLPMPTAAVCHFDVAGQQLDFAKMSQSDFRLDFHDTPKSDRSN
ncbi:MAG: histidine phosphatase family protein [Gammaproteobacteria bacterium]|nr:histidine phosphatase family protein [Gammaproteobacteria bacterium]